MNQLCSAKGSIILQSGRRLIRECCCWQIITLGWKYLNNSRPQMVPTWLHCEALKYNPSSFPVGTYVRLQNTLSWSVFVPQRKASTLWKRLNQAALPPVLCFLFVPTMDEKKTNIALNFGNYALQVSFFIDRDRDYTLKAALREFNFETAEGEMGDIWILRNVNKTPNFWHRI